MDDQPTGKQVSTDRVLVDLTTTNEITLRVAELNERLSMGEHLYGSDGLAQAINEVTNGQKVVVFDLDGVLKAEDENQINPEAITVIKALKDQGYLVAVWSNGMRENFDKTPSIHDLPIDLVICRENYQHPNEDISAELDTYYQSAIAYSQKGLNLAIPADQVASEYLTSKNYKHPDMVFDRCVLVDNTNTFAAAGVLNEVLVEEDDLQIFIYDQRKERTYVAIAVPTLYVDTYTYGGEGVQPLANITSIVERIFENAI